MLEVPTAYLNRVLYVRRDRARYRRFEIPKRNGGSRVISAPPRALAVLQHKLKRVLHLVYRPKPSTHAFVLDRNIVTNALPHVGKRWILNVDLEDFFPSVNFGRVRGALMARPFGLPKEAATVLAQICTTHEGVLPQGAPTSPVIANIVCGRLDGELMALSRRYRMTFTRYCDDLSLSSRQHDFPADIAVAAAGWIGEQVRIGPALSEVIDANGFAINPAKTRLQSRSCHQEVTGLTVNVFANTPRRLVRALRAMLHNWQSLGLEAAAEKYARDYHLGSPIVGRPEERFKRVLRGRIEYVGMVRGRTDPVYCKLRERLHVLDPTLIAAAPSPSAYRMPTSGRGGDAWTRVFNRVQNSVLHLVSECAGEYASGTALAFDRSHLATAAHTLKRSAFVVVHSANAEWAFDSALLHARGPSQIDAALLAHSHGLEPLAHSDRIPSPGEQVGVIGFATVPGRHPGLGLYVGTVESIRWDHPRTTQFIHVSMAAGGGLSGSPLLDVHGRLLGIVTESVYEQTAGDVPNREYCTVLPVSYLRGIDRSGNAHRLPMDDH